MLGELKDSLLPEGEMKDILRQDIADCNANMLGELKDSLLPAIRNIYGEAKEEMKRESDLSRNQILGDLKESVRPVIKTIKEELKGEILESTVKVMGDMREYLHQLIKDIKDEIGKDLLGALRDIPDKASIVASKDSTSWMNSADLAALTWPPNSTASWGLRCRTETRPPLSHRCPQRRERRVV